MDSSPKVTASVIMATTSNGVEVGSLLYEENLVVEVVLETRLRVGLHVHAEVQNEGSDDDALSLMRISSLSATPPLAEFLRTRSIRTPNSYHILYKKRELRYCSVDTYPRNGAANPDIFSSCKCQITIGSAQGRNTYLGTAHGLFREYPARIDGRITKHQVGERKMNS